MKKIAIYIGILLLTSLFLQAYSQEKPDEKFFYEAKILIFDKEWEDAQEKLEEILEKYPKSPWYSQAVFYRAKCLEEQRGKEVEALNAYKDYIKRKDRSESLVEEAESSIIDLAYKLYKKGKKSYLKEIEKRLSSRNKAIKYFAAIQLSLVKEKRTAARAVPVLKEILKKEKDDELRDRAKIALLRIDPDALKDMEERREERRAKILNIRIWKIDEFGNKELTLKINIPWALADLALSAISEEERALMRAEGYDPDRIIKEIEKIGEIFMIESKDTIIKIWID